MVKERVLKNSILDELIKEAACTSAILNAAWKDCPDDQCKGYGYDVAYCHDFGILKPCEACDGEGGWYLVQDVGRVSKQEYQDALEMAREVQRELVQHSI